MRVKKMIQAMVSLLARVVALQKICLVLIGYPFREMAINISTIGGFLGIEVRRYFYLKLLRSCGANLIVRRGSYIAYRDSVIGFRCAIEEGCAVSLCEMGDNVILAESVKLLSGGRHHDVDDLNTLFRDSILPPSKIKIGNNVWVGVGAIVMADVGDGAVVGAGAVVTKPVLDNSINVGNPAKFMRFRGKLGEA